MSWQKTRNTGDRNDHPANVQVDEANPLPVQLIDVEDNDPQRVVLDMQYQPPLSGQTRLIGPIKVPGIGTASAYADGDAFGTLITFPDCFRAEKCSGTIVGALFWDLDDEGLQKDVPLFTRAITVTTDNSAFALSDSDLLLCRGVVAISSFSNWGNNQMGQNVNTSLWVVADTPHLYTQIVTRGADNIAAGAEPWIALLVVPD